MKFSVDYQTNMKELGPEKLKLINHVIKYYLVSKSKHTDEDLDIKYDNTKVLTKTMQYPQGLIREESLKIIRNTVNLQSR